MDTSVDKKQRMVVALLRFNKAWEELANASKALPDLDVSDLYPFFMLDYEEIYPAVKQWCLVQASNLLSEIPDRIPNPACAFCPHVLDGLNTEGMCKGQTDVKCSQYPLIHFERTALIPFCQVQGIETEGVSDEILQLNYTRKVKEIYENQRKNSNMSNVPMHDDKC